jgi:hypothetical protein
MVNSTTNGLLSVAVVECPPCRSQWELTVRITRHAVDSRSHKVA